MPEQSIAVPLAQIDELISLAVAGLCLVRCATSSQAHALVLHSLFGAGTMNAMIGAISATSDSPHIPTYIEAASLRLSALNDLAASLKE